MVRHNITRYGSSDTAESSSVGKAISWGIAFVAVLSFYGHTFFNVPSAQITPIFAGLIALGLASSALLGISHFRIKSGSSGVRGLSAIILVISIVGFCLTTIYNRIGRPANFTDWGVFAVQVGTPILLLMGNRRLEILQAIGYICVGFAALDAIANILAWSNIVELSTYGGRVDQEGFRVRYPGLSGNTHAAGYVATIAICMLSVQLREKRGFIIFVLICAIGVLFLSLQLIDARRYFWMSVVAVGLLLITPARRISPIVTVMLLSVSAIYATFKNVFDFEDDLRARLMLNGVARVLQHPWLGQGVTYKDSASLQPGFVALSSAGVTESEVLDLAISYGIPSAALFIVSCLLALSARRFRQSYPVVILTIFTAELAYGGSLTGFLGSITFFSALIFIQQDEFS